MSISRILTARVAMLLAVAVLVAGCDEAASIDEESAATNGSAEAEAAVRQIGASASFRGINGIHFGPNGDLWLASVVTPAVARIDPESGEILENRASATVRSRQRPRFRAGWFGLLDGHQQRRGCEEGP